MRIRLGEHRFPRREAARAGGGGVVAPARRPRRAGRALSGRGRAARPVGRHRGRGGARGRRVRCGQPARRPRGDENAACARRAGRAANRPQPGGPRTGRRNRGPVAGLHPHRCRRRRRVVNRRSGSRPAARRPRRGARAASVYPRRGPRGRGCQAAQARSSHRAGEHRRSGRRRQLRRIRRAGHRRAAQPPLGRRPDRQHAGRRPGRRPGDDRRGPVRAGGGRGRRGVLRLHRAGRHAGHAQPRQDRPRVRDGRPKTAAGGAVRRGRRWPSRGHRRRRRRRAGRADLPDAGRAERPGAAGVDRLRPLLRRQRRAGRGVRRDHRDPGRQHRDGRPGDDRGRRARGVPAGGDRADRRAAAQRRGRAWSPATRHTRCRWPSSICRISRAALDDWEAPDPRLARHVVPQNRLRAYDVHRAIESIVDVGSVLELRPDYGVGIVTALVRVEGARVRADRQQHPPSRRRHRRRGGRQGRRLPRSVRVVSAAGDFAVRHPGLHGRAGRGEGGGGPAVRPDVRRWARA